MQTQRIHQLIEKMNALKNEMTLNADNIISLDLMMDYTRVLYSDLLELRSKIIPAAAVAPEPSAVIKETVIIAENKEGIVIERPQMSSTDTVVREQPLAPQEDMPEAAVPELQVPLPDADDIERPQAEKVKVQVQEGGDDVRAFITINDRILFLSELFNSNKFDYESALDVINTFSDFKTLERWLDENYFYDHRWDRDDKTVVLFLEVIQNKFR